MSIVDLRLALLERTPGVRIAQTAREGVERFVEESLALAETDGASLQYAGPGGVRAHLTWASDDDSWYGVPVLRVLADARPDDAGAMAWLADRLDEHLPRFGDDFDLQLSGQLVALVPTFYRHGFGIDSLIQIGDVPRALARIPTGLDARLRAAGVTAEPLNDDTTADEVAALCEQVFTAEPEYCWFAPLDGHARVRRDELHRDVGGGERLVLRREGRVVGTVAASVSDSTAWGRKAGMDLVFDRSIRGKGLATWAYRATLERAAAQGADVFRGGTSQPAVLALGRRLGRSLDALMIRRNPTFDAAHFGL